MIVRPLVRGLCLFSILAVLLSSRVADAQVEARCLPGWDTLPTPAGGPGARAVVACNHDPLQIVVSLQEHAIAPGSPDETEIAQQIAARLSETGNGTATPFRNETVAGVAARVSDVSGSRSAPDGTTTQLGGEIVLIPVGTGTVAVMAISRNSAQSDVRPALRAFLPTIVGLTGGPPAWRASASCPPGTVPSPTGEGASAMRLVARCTSPQGLQLEVLESRLPIRNADDARLPALNLLRSLQAQLGRIGGQATIDATAPLTVHGVHGFITAVHASASDPRAPPGTSAAMIRVEAAMAAIQTPIGHVEVHAITQAGDAAALHTQLESFVADQLRLDGTGVPPPTPPAPPAVDAGAVEDASSSPVETPAQPTPPREHEVDMNQPLWQPPPVERPHATEPPPKKGCGCTTPGAASHGAFASLALAAVVLASASRRRARSRRRRV